MRNEQGAITIHVAIALIALLAFSSFVIDYGVLWVSRRQAQNAADAGALAGAVSLIRDGGATPTAKISAETFAAQSYHLGPDQRDGELREYCRGCVRDRCRGGEHTSLRHEQGVRARGRFPRRA